MLQLEAFAALPHLLLEIGEGLPSRLLGILDLLGGVLQLFGARENLVLDRLDLGNLGFDRAEPADLLLLPPEPGVELPVHSGELRDLGCGPIHRLALLLQHGGLLGNLVRQGLEYRELMLHVGDGGGCLIDRLHLPLHRLHPAHHIFELAGGCLEVLIEVLQPRGGVTVSRQGVIVLSSHAGDVFSQLAQLSPERVGIGAECREGALEAEERFDLFPEQQSRLDLVAQSAHLTLEPFHGLGGVAQPDLGGVLGLDDPLDLVLSHGKLGAEPIQPGNLTLDISAALP
jgi:hypothetical protein